MKKILAIMAALCAIGCTGNVDPRQGGDTDEVIRELKALGFDTERTMASIRAAAGPLWIRKMSWA